MPSIAEKQLVCVGKVGPGFSGGESQQAHHLLDTLKVPRICGDRMMSLAARISWLNGQLTAARLAAGYVRKAKKAVRNG